MSPEHPGLKLKSAEIAGKIMESMGADMNRFRPENANSEDIPGIVFKRLFDAIQEKIKE